MFYDLLHYHYSGSAHGGKSWKPSHVCDEFRLIANCLAPRSASIRRDGVYGWLMLVWQTHNFFHLITAQCVITQRDGYQAGADCGIKLYWVRQSAINLSGYHIWQHRSTQGGSQFSRSIKFYVWSSHFKRGFKAHRSSYFILACPLLLLPSFGPPRRWQSKKRHKSSMSLLISPITRKQARVIVAAPQSWN